MSKSISEGYVIIILAKKEIMTDKTFICVYFLD